MVEYRLSNDVFISLEAFYFQFLSELRVFIGNLKEIRFSDRLAVHVKEDFIQEFRSLLEHNTIISYNGTCRKTQGEVLSSIQCVADGVFSFDHEYELIHLLHVMIDYFSLCEMPRLHGLH